MLLVTFTEKVEVSRASDEGSQDLLAVDRVACVSQNPVLFRWDPSAVKVQLCPTAERLQVCGGGNTIRLELVFLPGFSVSDTTCRDPQMDEVPRSDTRGAATASYSFIRISRAVI